MTAMFDVGERPAETLGEVTERISALLALHGGSVSWWVEMVDLLDALRARMSDESLHAAGLLRMREQIRNDAPYLFFRVRGLEREGEALDSELLRLRMQMGEAAGDESARSRLSAEARDLLAKVRRFRSRSRAVLVDAYGRDIGGE